MQCIYLIFNGICGASPPNVGYSFRPDEETLKAYCKKDPDMKACPRVHQYEDYLEASNTKPKSKPKLKKEISLTMKKAVEKKQPLSDAELVKRNALEKSFKEDNEPK